MQKALAGESTISTTFRDETLGCYVNRYAMPIYKGGVDGQVHAHIVDSQGKFVVRNQTCFIHEDARSIFDTPAFSDELQQTILSAFAVNESAFLSLTNEGVLYEVALIPMGVND